MKERLIFCHLESVTLVGARSALSGQAPQRGRRSILELRNYVVNAVLSHHCPYTLSRHERAVRGVPVPNGPLQPTRPGVFDLDIRFPLRNRMSVHQTEKLPLPNDEILGRDIGDSSYGDEFQSRIKLRRKNCIS